MKDSSLLVTIGYMKIVLNSNKNLVLRVAKEKYFDESNDAFDPCRKNEVLEMGQAS